MASTMAKFPLALLNILLVLAVLDVARGTRFCQKVVEPLGYGCAEYTVQTDDGFVLVMQRLSRVDSLAGKGHKNGCNDGKTQGATSSVSAHPAYSHIPAAFECTDADPQPHHTHSSDGSTTERLQPIFSSGSTPASDNSVSPSRTPEYSSAGQASIGASPAPSSAFDAPGPSAPQEVINGITSSNYTSNPEAGKGSPVLLMHMEFLSGDSWFQYVDADRHDSRLLPLMLLEDGFDVWIGHQRATYWGHGHAQLKCTDREYWDWTWDQHVAYDLPAQLRFITTETNRHVHFIGASQAATVGAAAATDTETSKMIRSLTLIGPTAFRGNSNSFLLNAWAYFFGVTLDTTYYTTGFQNGAFNYSSEFPQSGPISGQGLTGMTIGLISGPNCCLGSASVQMINGWDGTTSFKNLLHWQQGIRTNSFQHFDYGTAASNLKAYGQATPPAYNTADIPSRLPTLIIGGGKDWFAPPEGTNNLISQMQRPATLVNLTNYAHFDLYFSVHREKDIYLPILQFLEGPDF